MTIILRILCNVFFFIFSFLVSVEELNPMVICMSSLCGFKWSGNYFRRLTGVLTGENLVGQSYWKGKVVLFNRTVIILVFELWTKCTWTFLLRHVIQLCFPSNMFLIILKWRLRGNHDSKILFFLLIHIFCKILARTWIVVCRWINCWKPYDLHITLNFVIKIKYISLNEHEFN